ncbi:MAG: hexose kinase [Oscillochloris sp.]|nr:hexose kinase [Oscillochloris sp.]
MLLIITPNPSLDRTMVFADLRLGAVLRTDQVIVAAGGKGLNVARAARTLGQAALVCAPLGGLTGDLVAQLAAGEGIAGRWSQHTAGETRTCILLVSASGGDATALNEAGPIFGAADWATYQESILAAARDAAICLVSGSLPRGVEARQFAALLGALGAAGQRVIVDTSGAALSATLAARPYGIKVNAAELGAALGYALPDIKTAAAALEQLRESGLELAAVSLGAEGALAADDSGIWWACPPVIELVSTIGSGDSLLAGLACGLLRGLALPEALRLGVACGSADALTIGGGLIRPHDVEQLATQTQLKQVLAPRP